jgi:hypothetical protein
MPSVSESQVFEAKRRARNYWNVDGLPTLVSGLFLLLFVAITQTPAWLGAWLVFPWVFIALYECLDQGIVRWLKERLTYPRTGYVASQEERDPPSDVIQLSLNREEAEVQRALRPSLTAAILAVVAAAPVLIWSIVLVRPWIDTGWVEASFFLMLAIAKLRALNRDKLAYIDVFGFLLAAVADAVFPARRGLILFLAPGMVFTARGAITLLRYMRRNPVVQA